MKNFFKLIIILLCLFNTFTEILSYEQLLENWRKRINRPLYDWRIYLNADGVLVRDGRFAPSQKNYKLPDLQFYKKSDLSGEP